jgi:ribosomal protein S18 acetylase RimI-like enzyme
MSPGLFPPFCSAPGAFKFLTRADSPAILNLYDRCSDYFLIQDGEPAAASDADELFDDVPPSKQAEDQHVLGYYGERRLDAVAALVTDYPGPGDWYLGLLLLDPHQRGRGLGRRLYADLERWSADRGAKRMLLAVLKENAQAQCFWRSLGFEHVRTVQPATLKQKSHVRYELARRL